jgi:hypothetical protein
LFYGSRGIELAFRPRQFKSVNRIEQGGEKSVANALATVEIYMLASEKDVDCLEITLPYAYRSVAGLSIARVVLVVPDVVVHYANQILGGLDLNFQVWPESHVVSYSDLAEIQGYFGERSGWVYQQTLKLALLQNCPARFALVVDSDTVLLNPREWVDANGSLALTPTEEFNEDYFLFLEKMGFLDFQPEMSFIPHHMFYEISVFQSLTSHHKIESTSQIINKIKDYSDVSSSSPFSLDYELYAQWSLSRLNKRVRFIRWSNISVSRARLGFFRSHPRLLVSLRFLYNSISFHSWN